MRFSWRIFLIVFAIWVVGASLVQRYMDSLKGQLVLGGVQILSSFWVLFDALEKRLPKPKGGEWHPAAVADHFSLVPGQKKRPKQPCPFVEAQVSPITRAVLFILLAVFVYLVFKQAPLH